MLEEGNGADLLSEDSKAGKMIMGSFISGSMVYFIPSSICGVKTFGIFVSCVYYIQRNILPGISSLKEIVFKANKQP